MAVSVRTRLPVCNACRNRAERTGPLVPSSWARSKARRTWPTTSVSPVTTDSRPEVTEKRWAVTSSSKRMAAWVESSSTESAGLLGQDVVDLGHRVVEAVDHGVDLGAQAGREDHRLEHVAPVAQRAQHLVQVLVGYGRRLEQWQRCLGVLEPYDDDGHSDPSWVGPQLCRSRDAGRQSRGQRRPTPLDGWNALAAPGYRRALPPSPVRALAIRPDRVRRTSPRSAERATDRPSAPPSSRPASSCWAR